MGDISSSVVDGLDIRPASNAAMALILSPLLDILSNFYN